MIAGSPLPASATPRMRMLAQVAAQVTTAPWMLARADRERAHAAGLDDDDLLHAIALSAYFGHLNRIADAVAVPLDYAVQLEPPHADPSTPPLRPAPSALTGRAAIDLQRRPATATAISAWRSYVFDRDAPLPRRQRVVIARWVAFWLGDGSISSPDDLTINPLDDELSQLAELVTLAPWRLAPSAYEGLRGAGYDDVALFDAIVTASTAGMLSRITVALAAVGRE